MKKIFAIAVIFITAITVNAQDLTYNYQKVYAGWINKQLSGYEFGYAYAFNIARYNLPVFIELGAEYTYLSESDSKIKVQNLSVPVNITYKIGNEKFSIAPFVGQSFRLYLSATEDGISIYDDVNRKVNRVQAVFNAGMNFVIWKHLHLGYRFQASETALVESGDPKNDYTNTISLGYVF